MLVGGFKNYVPGTGNLYYVVYVLPYTCLVMYVMWCTGTRVHVKPQLLGLYCQKSLSLLSVFHSITVHPGNVRIRPLRTPNKPSCIRDPLL
jgi:hypothetical protein